MEADEVVQAIISELESGHAATTDAGLRIIESGYEDTSFFLVHDDGQRFLVMVAKVGE